MHYIRSNYRNKIVELEKSNVWWQTFGFEWEQQWIERNLYIYIFCKKEKEMCPLLIGILSFYKHILPRNIRLIFEVREKNVLLHFLIIILIWEMATTQKCFTHIDWHFAMTANLPLRVLFHHRMYFIFAKT